MTVQSREQIIESISLRLLNRNEDEVRVIEDVLSGLERGALIYGPLDTRSDNRDFEEQLSQELRDGLTYQSAWRIARQHRRRERLHAFVHDDAYARVSQAMEPLVTASFTVQDGVVSEVLK
jgi:hypothetical protein